MNTNNPFPSAAPDFSEPLGLLRTCHENIFQFSTMVERLAQYLNENGPDQAARETAAKIHRYFSTSAKQHHADEEEELFPRLVRKSAQLADTVHRLEREHKQLDSLWQELEPLLRETASIEDTAAFAGLAQRFADAQRDHASRENHDILEQAQQLFDTDELKQIGRAMAERRGINLPATFQV